MKVFLVIWNVILTITLVVFIMLCISWSSLMSTYANSLQEWFENDFEGAVKSCVDKRMEEYLDIIVKEVIKASLVP